jgi:hypothetical protein
VLLAFPDDFVLQVLPVEGGDALALGRVLKVAKPLIGDRHGK